MTFRMKGIYQLLTRHGKTVTIKYESVDTTYNPATGETTTTTVPNTQVKGYFYRTKLMNRQETLIEDGDRRLILYPHDINGVAIRKPKPSDTAIGQNDNVRILSVQEVVSGQKVLFYICAVKE